MNITNTPVVIVVNRDDATRKTLESLIRASGWEPRCYGCAMEFLRSPREMTPGCMVLDVMLPDLDGLELQRRVADRPELPVVFVTSKYDVRTTVCAMKAGAFEFLTMPVPEEVIVNAIRMAIDQSRDALSRESDLKVLRGRHALLSRREREVLERVVRGLRNKVIAFELGISEITVKAHRGQVMRKMQVQSLAELVTIVTKLAIDFTLSPVVFDSMPTCRPTPLCNSGGALRLV